MFVLTCLILPVSVSVLTVPHLTAWRLFVPVPLGFGWDHSELSERFLLVGAVRWSSRFLPTAASQPASAAGHLPCGGGGTWGVKETSKCHSSKLSSMWNQTLQPG